MPLDLSHPRYLVPPPSHSTTGTAGLRRAVHLKLTEDVLKQLLDVVAPPTKQGGEHKVAGGQIMVNVDGPHPVLVVGGISHPLSVVPEAADTSLVRLSPASRDLVPFATVSHRATVQHRPADLDKAGQRARENREQVERAKEARKAVLLDEPPRIGNGLNSSSKKRSASNPRPRQLGTAVSASASGSSTPHPLSAPSSRLASPAVPASPSLASSAGPTSASTVRHPSRLTAVPQTAAPPVSAPAPSTAAAAAASRPPVGPSGTFRIGKGAVPASLSRSASASSSTSSSSSSSSSGSAIPLAAATASLSNARAAADGGKSTEPAEVKPALNGTEEAAKATKATTPSPDKMEIDPPPPAPPVPTESTSASLSKQATTTARSSPPPLETGADKSPASSKGDHKPIRPGGGGLMKGKESLKKEKRREERQRESRPNAAASGPAPPAATAVAKSTTSVVVPKGVNASKIKSEAFVNDSDDEMSDVDADGEADADGQVDDGIGSEDPATVAAATKPTEPKSSPFKVNKDSPPERKKRRLEEPAPKPVRKASFSSKTAAVSPPKMHDKPLKRSTVVESAPTASSKDSGSEATITAGARPKKRKKEAVKRWYSSSSEDDDAETTNRDRAVKGKNGGTLDGARVEPLAKTASPEKASPSELAAGPRAASRMSYLEAYVAYAELYARLAAERAALEQGSAGSLLAAAAGDGPRRVRSMIHELSEKRRALEGLHSGSTRGASS